MKRLRTGVTEQAAWHDPVPLKPTTRGCAWGRWGVACKHHEGATRLPQQPLLQRGNWGQGHPATLLCVFDLVKTIHSFYTIKIQSRNTESQEKSENRQNHLETHQRPPKPSREAPQIASGRSHPSFPQSSPDRPVFSQITSAKSHVPSSSALQPPMRLA